MCKIAVQVDFLKGMSSFKFSCMYIAVVESHDYFFIGSVFKTMS